jgi:hypothetical protein
MAAVASAEEATLQRFNHLHGEANFPRYIWPDFLQYLCERPEMSSQ